MWLKILASDETTVTLSWGNSAGPFPDNYQIGLASLKHAARSVRTELQRLAACDDPKDFPIILACLARAGAMLRYVLFDAPSKYAQITQAVKEWLSEQYDTGDRTLSI